MVENQYAMANSMGRSHESYLIKEACLNLSATILLLELNQGVQNAQALFAQFYKVLTLILQDLADFSINTADRDQLSFKS